MEYRFKVGDRVRARFGWELTIRHAGRGQYGAADESGVEIGPFSAAYVHEHWQLVAWAPPTTERYCVCGIIAAACDYSANLLPLAMQRRWHS